MNAHVDSKLGWLVVLAAFALSVGVASVKFRRVGFIVTVALALVLLGAVGSGICDGVNRLLKRRSLSARATLASFALSLLIVCCATLALPTYED